VVSIEFELALEGIAISRRTVSRIALQLGLNRRRFIDPRLARSRGQRSAAHGAQDGQPPASVTPDAVNNVLASYT